MSKPSFIERGSTRKSDDTSVLDYDSCVDDRDDTKRRTRNLSEKKRRDQFNILINELNGMISTNTRKMDKSTVLKSAISFLKNHNDITEKSRDHEVEGEWKPSFISNSEFAHLILEAVDGFVIVLSTSGVILYASDNITSLLGHLPMDLQNVSIYDLIHEIDQPFLYNLLHKGENKENRQTIHCHLKTGGLLSCEEKIYEFIELYGYFRTDSSDADNTNSCYTDESTAGHVFIATGRLLQPLIIRDVSTVDSSKTEFTSRHSLEWKFLFLDHRATPIIGYLPFEVLGTSGYDYYHIDDLDKLVTCHESLMQKGEATSSYYRFLMKGQQWIWLQTRFYVTYHQWNSKPEFVVCTHHVVSSSEVLRCREQQAVGRRMPLTTVRLKQTQRSRMRSHSDTASTDSRQSQLTVRSNRSCSYPPPPLTTQYVAVAPSLMLPSSPQLLVPGPRIACAQPPLVIVTSPQALLAPSLMMSPQPIKTHELQNLSPLVLTSSQSAMQEQLQRKHQQLQQLITAQQAELRRVSKQLMMARCGVMPTDGTGSTCSAPLSADMFPDTLSPLAAGATRADFPLQPTYAGNELLPFELSHQQAQQLFHSANQPHQS